MSDMRVLARQAPSATNSGNWIAANAAPDGTLAIMPWIQNYVNLGYGFHMSIGAFSTPIQGGGAGTIFDQDQPEGILSVPSGTAVLPFRIGVHCQVPLLAADSDEAEILVAVDKDTAYPGDGTVTAETAFNLRMNHTRTSGCTAASAATGNITNPTLDLELAHRVIVGDVQGTAANALWTPLDLHYEPATVPVLYGPCALYIYWGGTVAVTGFADVQWLEFSSDMASKLFP